MRIGLLMSSVCCLALAPLAGHAAEPGFYVGIGAGQSDYEVSGSDGIAVQIGGPFGGGVFMVRPSSTNMEDDGLSWNAVIGYRMHTYVAAELAYMNFADSNINERFDVAGLAPFGPPSFSITRRTRLAVKGPAVSVLGILPLGAGWETYIRGGVLFADLESEAYYTSGSDEMTFGSEKWLAGAGVQWNFAGRWAWRLEYQRIDTIDRTFRNGEVDVDQLALGVSFAL